ncbi:predicted protein [Lichtheimia corymbifera JMRC:FSU:9682]|uniref:Uncharacterized protein n=1 Tax=Lichtheimia corymbifera JMRC:FSU:9682 TaxID=1263082 RepID=A0A068S466_9FUNG|nr:predicted protein [Lichtheimia corymbifera JMRC:FSU:9682]
MRLQHWDTAASRLPMVTNHDYTISYPASGASSTWMHGQDCSRSWWSIQSNDPRPTMCLFHLILAPKKSSVNAIMLRSQQRIWQQPPRYGLVYRKRKENLPRRDRH